MNTIDIYNNEHDKVHERSSEAQKTIFALQHEEATLKKEVMRGNPPREIRQKGANTISIPYDLGEDSWDFVITRNPDNTLSIEIFDPNTGNRLDGGKDSRSVPIQNKEHFFSVLGGYLDLYILNDTRKIRPTIPTKASDTYSVLFSTDVDRIFAEADFVQLKKDGPLLWSQTKSFYDTYLVGKLDFGDLSQEDYFDIILNALIDYNKDAYRERHFERTDHFFRPKQLSYYQGYVDEVKENFSGSKSTPTIRDIDDKKSVQSAEKLEKIVLDSALGELMKYGRNGMVNVGKIKKQKEEDYVYMKGNHARFDKKVPGTRLTYYDYIEQQLEKSDLSPTMKKLVKCIPMQESGFKNAYFSHHRFDQAQYLRQFIKDTAEDYGMIVNSKKDERKDIKKSTAGAISFFGRLYKDALSNKDLQALFTRYKISDRQTKDLITSFFALNGYNSGPAHMPRAFEVMRYHEQKKTDKFVKKYGPIGLILYVTNEYPKKASIYQKGFSRKYLKESPSYVYNVLKFYELDQKG